METLPFSLPQPAESTVANVRIIDTPPADQARTANLYNAINAEVIADTTSATANPDSVPYTNPTLRNQAATTYTVNHSWNAAPGYYHRESSADARRQEYWEGVEARRVMEALILHVQAGQTRTNPRAVRVNSGPDSTGFFQDDVLGYNIKLRKEARAAAARERREGAVTSPQQQEARVATAEEVSKQPKYYPRGA